MTETAYFSLYGHLPRAAPGNIVSTLEALRRLPPLPAQPVVYDAGCGPGQQTLALARALRSPVIGVDLHAPFLARLRTEASWQGLGALVRTLQQDMLKLPAAPRSVDLIWSEGAVYCVGFQQALTAWKPLLKPRGAVVVSEATWLTPQRPPEAVAFWQEGYPAMTDIQGNKDLAQRAGFQVLDHFTLPRHAWFQDYYDPLAARIETMRNQASAELQAVILEAEREIDICQKHGNSYGYVFYLLQAPG